MIQNPTDHYSDTVAHIKKHTFILKRFLMSGQITITGIKGFILSPFQRGGAYPSCHHMRGGVTQTGPHNIKH